MKIQNNLFNLSIKSCLLVLLILTSFTVQGQKNADQLDKISHQEFLSILSNTKDSIILIKDTFVYIKENESSFEYTETNGKFNFSAADSIVVEAQLRLENVHFQHLYENRGTGLHHIRFNRPVVIINSSSLVFSNCVFKEGYYLDINMPMNPYIDSFEYNYDGFGADLTINESEVYGDFTVDIGTIDTYSSIFLTVLNSTFKSEKATIYTNNIRSFDCFGNVFHGSNLASFYIDRTRETLFSNNQFKNSHVVIGQAGVTSESVTEYSNNYYDKYVLLSIEDFSKSDVYEWKDWENKVISLRGYLEYFKELNRDKTPENYFEESLIANYNQKEKFRIEKAYKFEKRLFGGFYNFYTSQYDTDFGNMVYVALKNLDTYRFEYLYAKQPTFNNYFKWKINQFLKVFSMYGTSPSKTVVISIYVILIFAFIYLFFPNSWDTINKNRLINRLKFYTKYFRSEQSMKDLYEEQNSKEYMTYVEFKQYMGQSKKETPAYFMLLSKPIFYFSGANYKIARVLLGKMDVLKGRWIDLPKKKKIISSIVVGVWIFFLLLFDLLIKFLNALTLSINTFTTLGFGEIPTTGIPRYLAIIQGFIGWFMLSIFSVSLISQILN